MEEDLLDWELLHGSDTDSIPSDEKSGSSSVIDDGMILSDHFSIDNNLINRSGETTDPIPTQYAVLESGDSFRVDYGSDSPEVVRVDSSSGHLDVCRSGDTGIRNEFGLNYSKTGISGDGEVIVSDIEAADEKHVEGEAGRTLSHYEDASKCLFESDDLGRYVESQSGVDEMVSGDFGVVNGEEEIVSDSGLVSSETIEGNGENSAEVVAVRSGDEGESRETVWWKMPFVLLKYSVFRIGPVWSVSLAAAVMGLVLFGRRRLYDMKKKAQKFNLEITIDDKKVSRVMNQAARLNEMFTEVRRVPVIRPALPSPGAWPVLSLR